MNNTCNMITTLVNGTYASKLKEKFTLNIPIVQDKRVSVPIERKYCINYIKEECKKDIMLSYDTEVYKLKKCYGYSKNNCIKLFHY